MAYIPPRSACFRPDEYRDLVLFADRSEERDELVSVLESYLEPDAPGSAHLLVRGSRGVGKSILARKIVSDAKEKWALLVAEADCATIGVGPEAVLRALARTLADEAVKNALDEGVRKEAQILSGVANSTKIKARDVRTWTEQLKLGVSATLKLYDTLAFEFGMTRAAGRSKEVEQSFERNVDVVFLQELIAGFLGDCARAEQKIVVFVDNLDQAANPEKKEDVEQVVDLCRFLSGLGNGVVLMTLRSEFVSRDLHKLYRYSLELAPMKAEGLLEVSRARMKSAGARQYGALVNANFAAVATTLSGWTGNPWGFLTWLQQLDYAKVDVSHADPATLKSALLVAIRPLFPGLRDEELQKIAYAFGDKPNGYLTRAELNKEGLADDLIERAVSFHALVPDWLLEAHGYHLPPQLHFLAVG